MRTNTFLKAALVICALSTGSAFGAVECRQPGQDGVLAATFTGLQPGSITMVQLLVPTGESSYNPYAGSCTPDAGADEFAVTCEVMTSTDSGYTVRLYSEGSPELVATAQAWSMAGKRDPIAMKCEGSAW
ncbi:MAG: hypothetical protein AB7G93_08530 [Bdellovibrionales bacterium]